MSTVDGTTRVGNLIGSNFGNFLLASVKGVPVSATGDVTIPGALSAGIGMPFTQYRIRKVAVRSGLISGASGDVSSVNIGFWDAAAQGGNNIVANAALTNLTTNLKYQEMTITATGNNTILVSGTLFPNVGTSLANATVEIDVYGDVIQARE